MRVLVLTNMYPPHHYGGYELACHDVVSRFIARGHDVRVLTGDLALTNSGTGPIEHEARVHRRLRLYWDDHRLLKPPLPARIRIERANQAALKEVLDELRPDVVSVWNMASLSLGLLNTIGDQRVPVVYVICNDWLVFGLDHDPWMTMWAGHPRLRRVAHAVTGVPTELVDFDRSGTFCFISDATRRWAKEHTALTLPDSTVVYCGIESSLFAGGDTDVATQPWRWQLLYSGRIEREKGVLCAVRALVHLPEATLRLDGPAEPSCLDELTALARSLGVEERVVVDRSDRGALAGVYRAADVVIFPTQWEEPLGLAPLEAMACGTPVVATGAGGSAEFLADEVNCLLFGRGDDVALAGCVRRLSTDAALRSRLVANGTRTADALGIDAFADCLEDWHAGAAHEFVHGRPADRVSPLLIHGPG